MTKAQMEKKYGIKIEDDSYYLMSGRLVKQYKMYAADGCRWECGLNSVKEIEAECRKYGKYLIAIKNVMLANAGGVANV